MTKTFFIIGLSLIASLFSPVTATAEGVSSLERIDLRMLVQIGFAGAAKQAAPEYVERRERAYSAITLASMLQHGFKCEINQHEEMHEGDHMGVISFVDCENSARKTSVEKFHAEFISSVKAYEKMAIQELPLPDWAVLRKNFSVPLEITFPNWAQRPVNEYVKHREDQIRYLAALARRKLNASCQFIFSTERMIDSTVLLIGSFECAGKNLTSEQLTKFIPEAAYTLDADIRIPGPRPAPGSNGGAGVRN